MVKKRISPIVLMLLLVCMSAFLSNFQRAKAVSTIYIRADGSIDQPTLLMQRNGDLYTLLGDISSDAAGIVIERNNMTLDGAGYKLQGTGSHQGISIVGRKNITIINMEIDGFATGIGLASCSNTSITGNNLTANNQAAFDFFNCLNNTISGNTISVNNIGISLASCSNNRIFQNNLTANNKGIQLTQFSDKNTISENTATDNTIGMSLNSSPNNIIAGNNLTANTYIGILLETSANCSMTGNLMSDNEHNLDVQAFALGDLIQSIDISNLVNGKPVYYLTNQTGLHINSSTYPQIGYLALVNCTYITVDGVNLSDNGQGVLRARGFGRHTCSRFWETSMT